LTRHWALADGELNWSALIGRPWFSSIYITAAINGARQSNYLCVKSINILGQQPTRSGQMPRKDVLQETLTL